jgi:hypothetical protein
VRVYHPGRWERIIEGMYRVQYFCPRQSQRWQQLAQLFPSLAAAIQTANSLIWRYHSARVLDPSGRPVYQV